MFGVVGRMIREEVFKMIRKIKSLKGKKLKKIYLFLDTNFLRNYKSNEENFKKSLSELSKEYEICVSSLTAIELKNNKTEDGIETLKLLKYVKVLPTEMEMISNQDSIKYFSVDELLKVDNSGKYIELKKYIELNNRTEEINLIKELYTEIKKYGIEDIENAKKEIYIQKIKQFFELEEYNFLTEQEKRLYSISYLRIVEKILRGGNIGNRKNDFFDLGFLSTNYLDAHILTQDKHMIAEFVKLGYIEVKKHNNYTILKFNDIQELTYEEIYNLIVLI